MKQPADRLDRRGTRALVATAACIALAFWSLDLSWSGLAPHGGGLALLGEFLSAALHPAFDYQTADLPAGTPPFAVALGSALIQTLAFAAAGLGLSLVLGLPLGLACSEHFWSSASAPGRLAQLAAGSARLVAALARSVHELLWAVLFLAALGLIPALSVLAIAMTYAGTLAKLFGELLDEQTEQREDTLALLGATRLGAFGFGRVIPALPALLAYTFYRFECAVRSAAVLGFLGLPTLGLRIELAFESRHFAEVWTYLYVLIAVVVALELWSSRLRRRFVA